MFSLRHILRRLARQGFVTTSVLIGIAFAVALGIAVPLAIDALAPLGLRATIEGLPTPSRNIQLTRNGQPFDDAFRERTRRRLGDLIDHDLTVSYSPPLDALRESLRLVTSFRIRTQDDLAEHSIVTGRSPMDGKLIQADFQTAGCGDITGIDALLSADQAKS